MAVSNTLKCLARGAATFVLLGGLATVACAPTAAAPAQRITAHVSDIAFAGNSPPKAAPTVATPTLRAPPKTNDATPSRSLPSAIADAAIADAASKDIEALSDAALTRLFDEDRAAVGSLSIGKPNGGMLIGGVQLSDNELFEIAAPYGAWGTRETVEQLTAAARQLAEQFPDGHKIYIGHLSSRFGGRLHPHRSHQSGRDVDLGCCYKPKMQGWYQRGTRRNLDLKRSWALLRALLTTADVEYIFMNTSVQRLIGAFAEEAGEDNAWLDSVFGYRGRHAAPLIRHAWGHDTHWHVRFFNARAQRLAVRLFDALVERQIIAPRRGYVRHQVREGDSFASLAEHFATSKRAIVRTNGPWPIRPGRTYVIPVHRNVRRATSPVVPPRRLPPLPTAAPAGVGNHAVAAGR